MTRLAFLFFALCCFFIRAQSAPDDGVAGMVLDLQGNVQLSERGTVSDLQLLTYLKPGMQIKLTAGSKTSLSLYATRTVYSLTGPGIVEVGKDKLQVLQGSAPVAKSVTEKLVAAAQASNEVPGAYRLRQIPPRLMIVRPENRTLLLNRQPVFCWASQETATFHISVQDTTEHTVAQDSTSDTCWKFPATRQLDYGKLYHWTVSYSSTKDQHTYTAEAEFALPTQQEAEYFSALKPGNDASTEEWILYASTMRNQQLGEEARSAWQFIAARRPDLQKVQELAK